MLPSLLHLMVAEPRVSIKRALLILFVETCNVFPAGVVGIMRHDALVGKIIEVRAENSLYKMTLHI